MSPAEPDFEYWLGKEVRNHKQKRLDGVHHQTFSVIKNLLPVRSLGPPFSLSGPTSVFRLALGQPVNCADL
jgi:hypothetical protein